MSTARKQKTEAPYRAMKIGQGLGALFGELPIEPSSEHSVPITEISLPPQQPRRYFDPQAMESLVVSIRRDGVLEPLLVRQLEAGGYELVAGERRYRASKEVGLETVPVVIRQMSDEQALHVTLVENLLREDLNPLEETEGILQLLSLRLQLNVDGVISLLYRMQNDVQRMTHNVMGQPQANLVQTIFTEVGVSWESFINNRLPLLKLPTEVLNALREGKLAYTKAQSIARIKDDAQRQDLLEQVLSQDLSLVQIREQVTQINTAAQVEDPTAPNFRVRVDDICRRVKKAKVWTEPKKRQRLESLLADLERLLE
jgi:ParB family transcriptional regulator, chromosome partitioning protein